MYTTKLKLLFLSCLLILSCSEDSEEATKVIEDENGEEMTVEISANTKLVGDSAKDLLSEGTFDTVIIEILYSPGLAPTDNAVEAFSSFLEDRLNKKDGIQIEQREITSLGQTQYSIVDIRNIEDNNRTKYNDGKTIAVTGIFIDGEYDQNTEKGSVLGVAYRNTSFVIFEETIRSFSNQPLSPSLATLESVVINHEFGHLLGLVNAGTTMQTDHQDVEHGRHCTEEDCLMYWTAETGEGLLNMLTGGSVPDLDSQCVADLQANGGK